LSLRVVEISWNCNNSIGDSCSKVIFGNVFHLGQNHGGNLFWVEMLVFSSYMGFDDWFSVFVLNDVWKELCILLYLLIRELSSNESFDVVNNAFWVWIG
jgi:hypothetical protein